MRKDTTYIDILITSRNKDRKIMELSEYRMDLPQKKGNGTSSASLGEHLTKQKDLS